MSKAIIYHNTYYESQYNYYFEDPSLPMQVILGKVRVVPGEGAQPWFAIQCNKLHSILEIIVVLWLIICIMVYDCFRQILKALVLT